MLEFLNLGSETFIDCVPGRTPATQVVRLRHDSIVPNKSCFVRKLASDLYRTKRAPEPAKYYCGKRQSDVVVPCPARIPAGFNRIDMSHGPAQILVQVSFVSRVAITNSHSYYYLQMSRAPYQDPRYPVVLSCNAGRGEFAQSNSGHSAGQRVTFSMFENLSCCGPVHGDVSVVINTGPSAPAPMRPVRGQSIGRDVGHFTIDIP